MKNALRKAAGPLGGRGARRGKASRRRANRAFPSAPSLRRIYFLCCSCARLAFSSSVTSRKASEAIRASSS